MTYNLIIAEYTIRNNREFVQYRNNNIYPHYRCSWITGNIYWFDLSQFIVNLRNKFTDKLISSFHSLVDGWKKLADFLEKNRSKTDITKLTKTENWKEVLNHLFTEKGYRLDSYYRTKLQIFVDYDIKKRSAFKKYYNQIMIKFLLVIQRLNFKRVKEDKNILIHSANKTIKNYIGQFFAPTWSYHFNRWVDLIKRCPSRKTKHLVKHGNLLGVY